MPTRENFSANFETFQSTLEIVPLSESAETGATFRVYLSGIIRGFVHTVTHSPGRRVDRLGGRAANRKTRSLSLTRSLMT
eukprot:2925007-Rhodomonas_salina.4